jgi:polyhydroxybutyrate depolymerase
VKSAGAWLRGAALLALLLAAAASALGARAGDTPRSGCGVHVSSGSTVLSEVVGGHRRTIVVHVPKGYDGKDPVPLVLNLHGSGSTADQQEKFTGMDATADAKGFLVAYPQALIPEGSGFDWNVPGVPLVGGRAVPHGAANDVAFLTRLVGSLEQRYCIDAHRVYATGFSGGARLSSQLACGAARVFAAVAPVSGLRDPKPCPAARPVPIVAFHGTKDPVDPYTGHGQAYWSYSVRAAETGWAHEEHCARTAAVSHPASSVTLTRYEGCRDGSTVELYTVAGEGHEWPGGPALPGRYTLLLGPQSNAIDADALIWAFFAAHRLR